MLRFQFSCLNNGTTVTVEMKPQLSGDDDETRQLVFHHHSGLASLSTGQNTNKSRYHLQVGRMFS